MALLSMLVGPLVLSWVSPNFPAVPIRACRRAAAPIASAVLWAEPLLKDALTERAVWTQLHQFKMINDRGLQIWLKSSWDAFSERSDRPGESTRFIIELQHSKRESQFVPTPTIQQGRPENPFIRRDSNPGYHCEVEPPKIAMRLMRTREQLAGEWGDALNLLATGCNMESIPDQQLLDGLATRVAVQAMLHDLSLRPSQRELHEYLSSFLVVNAMQFESGGDVEAALADLSNRALCIRGSSLIDPPMLVDDIRSRRAEIQRSMAATLGSTSDEHLSLQTSFLEACFKAQF